MEKTEEGTRNKDKPKPLETKNIIKSGEVEAIENVEIIEKESIIESLKWVNQECYRYESMKMEGNSIGLKGDHGHNHGKIFSVWIVKGKFKFSFRIDCILTSVSIGITDKENTKLSSLNSNYLCYYSDGEFSADFEEISKEKSFKNGDVVTLFGDCERGDVGFKVNDICVCEYKYDKLMGGGYNWVPFVGLWKGESISVLNSFPEVCLVFVDLAEQLFDWDFDLIYEINSVISI